MTLPTTPSAVASSGDEATTTGAAQPHDRRPTSPTSPTSPSDPASRAGPDDGARPFDALEMEAWLAYDRVRHDLVAALERDLSQTGLSLGDYQVFVVLTSSDAQSMRMVDLAERLQLSPSGLTRRLDGLVQAGWIKRQSAEHDRRVMLAVVTPSGRRAFEQAIPVHVDSVRTRITGVLGEAELRAMADIFGKIRFELDAEIASPDE